MPFFYFGARSFEFILNQLVLQIATYAPSRITLSFLILIIHVRWHLFFFGARYFVFILLIEYTSCYVRFVKSSPLDRRTILSYVINIILPDLLYFFNSIVWSIFTYMIFRARFIYSQPTFMKYQYSDEFKHFKSIFGVCRKPIAPDILYFLNSIIRSISIIRYVRNMVLHTIVLLICSRQFYLNWWVLETTTFLFCFHFCILARTS